MQKILFVCLGNICRSPLAEGILQNLVSEKNLEADFLIESAGTAAYHVGEKPDNRSRKTAENHGFYLTSRARQFQKSDFGKFDFIIAMDKSNQRNILQMTENQAYKAKVYLMSDFDKDQKFSMEVPDPYYGGDAGFENVYQQLDFCCRNFLEEIA